MKKKLTHIPLLIMGLLLTLASNCKKPKEPTPKAPVTIYNYLGDVKDYCVFKQGTYWVYQNDLTGDLDSHWVSSCDVWDETQKGTEDYSKHITLKQERFDMFIRTNFVDGSGNKCYWEFYTLGANVDAFTEPVFIVTCRKVWSGGGTYNDLFGKPYRTENIYSVYQDTLYEKYNLNGFDYDSVRVMHVGYDGVFPESKVAVGIGNSDYYFAKGYGIIKIYIKGYRTFDSKPWNQTWSLIRKNIIQ